MMKPAHVSSGHLQERSPSFKVPTPHNSLNQERVSVIRGEFVALTGNLPSAVILNQLLYWTQRVKDLDLLLAEERSLLLEPQESKPFQQGWIYKTAKDLIEETMLGVSHPTMRTYLKKLIAQGWICERVHPVDKWNKTTQYRVNLKKIQEDLLAMGRTLPDVYRETFALDESATIRLFPSNKAKPQPPTSPSVSIEKRGCPENFFSDVKGFHSNVKILHSLYTENTTEIPNKEHFPRTRARVCEPADPVFLSMVELWKTHVGQVELHLTPKRTQQLQLLLEVFFQKDLFQWEAFCKRVKASPFLMGGGPQKWHVSLDWILRKENLLKVLEGNFDSCEAIQQRKEAKTHQLLQQKIEETLNAIQDPLWRDWCSQSLQASNPLSWWQLERMTNAQFVCFDGRCVVLGSTDARVLEEIEEQHFQLSSIVEGTFPTSRGIRTKLLKEANLRDAPASNSHAQQEGMQPC